MAESSTFEPAAPMFQELGFSRELYERRYSNSKKLLFAAWSIEIVAASIGLVIAALTAVATYEQIKGSGAVVGSSEYLNMFLGSLPFIMVAVVELMKIPLATAVYHSKSWLWKFIFSVSLAGLAIITFETAMNGFQRTINARTFTISQIREDLSAYQAEVDRYSAEIVVLNDLDSKGLDDQLETSRSAARQAIEDAYEDEEKAVTDARARLGSPAQAFIQKEIEGLEERRRDLRRQRDLDETRIRETADTSLAALQTSSATDRENILSQQNANQLALEQAEERRGVEIDRCNEQNSRKRACRNRVEEEYAPEILRRRNLDKELKDQYLSLSNKQQREEIYAKRDQDIERIHNEYQKSDGDYARQLTEKRARLAKSTEQGNSALAEALESISERTKTRIAQINAELKLVEDGVAQGRKNLSNRQEEIPRLEAKVSQARDGVATAKKQINEEASKEQIYQIAKIIYGKDSASDVAPEELRLVVLVWFGSLAAIVAFTGIVLAFGSLVLRYEHMRTHTTIRDWSARFFSLALRSIEYVVEFFRYLPLTARSLRSYWIHRRRQLSKEPLVVEKEVVKVETELREVEVPVQVVKEVPVEKVVFKEVPKEVVRKEFVYVPFYSDDPKDIDRLGYNLARLNDDN